MGPSASQTRKSGRQLMAAGAASSLAISSLGLASSKPVGAAIPPPVIFPAGDGPLIAGVVTDGSGRTRSGVRIRVYAAGGPISGFEDIGSAVSSADGSYLAELDRSVLAGRADRGGLVQVIVIPEQADGTPAIPRYLSLDLPGSSSSAASPLSRLRPNARVDLEADDGPSAAGRVVAAAAPRCYSQTVPYGSTSLPDTNAIVGFHQIDSNAAFWQSSITYSNTRSTSLQTGYSVTAGTGPLSFSVNGSVVNDSTIGSVGTNTVSGSNGTVTNRKQVITIGQRLDHFRCWQSNTTPPANPGYWPEISVTVVPGVWKRDYFVANQDGTPTATCSGGQSTYGPGPFSRVVGQSYTASTSFQVGVSANGRFGTFSGGATVTMSNTSNKQVTQSMNNTATNNKHLCGSKSPNLASATNVGIIVGKA